jgi:hypothetical protein
MPLHAAIAAAAMPSLMITPLLLTLSQRRHSIIFRRRAMFSPILPYTADAITLR